LHDPEMTERLAAGGQELARLLRGGFPTPLPNSPEVFRIVGCS
ncbi:hypothetical protein A2U01_0103698, partial [Trifolium medium]|nr:hypothetical protein [Trifolium medium]